MQLLLRGVSYRVLSARASNNVLPELSRHKVPRQKSPFKQANNIQTTKRYS